MIRFAPGKNEKGNYSGRPQKRQLDLAPVCEGRTSSNFPGGKYPEVSPEYIVVFMGLMDIEKTANFQASMFPNPETLKKELTRLVKSSTIPLSHI